MFSSPSACCTANRGTKKKTRKSNAAETVLVCRKKWLLRLSPFIPFPFLAFRQDGLSALPVISNMHPCRRIGTTRMFPRGNILVVNVNFTSFCAENYLLSLLYCRHWGAHVSGSRNSTVTSPTSTLVAMLRTTPL